MEVDQMIRSLCAHSVDGDNDVVAEGGEGLFLIAFVVIAEFPSRRGAQETFPVKFVPIQF